MLACQQIWRLLFPALDFVFESVFEGRLVRPSILCLSEHFTPHTHHVSCPEPQHAGSSSTSTPKVLQGHLPEGCSASSPDPASHGSVAVLKQPLVPLCSGRNSADGCAETPWWPTAHPSHVLLFYSWELPKLAFTGYLLTVSIKLRLYPPQTRLFVQDLI